ncbi:tetratricopeptide repeat protein [Vibrio vulnificus]|nr:hypothetical protein [Vibrio vulnificus]ELI3521914.1 hypothetical protein [Vibrio vulnificus]
MNALELYERYKSYLRYDPNNADLISKTIEYALKSGDTDNAWALSTLVIESFHWNAGCYYQAVTAALATHHYSEALSWLQETIQSDNPPSWALFNYAFALLQLGEYTKVINYISLHENLIQGTPGLTVLKARALFFLADYIECERELEQYITSFPDDANALGLLSLVLYDKGNLKKAEKIARNAIAMEEMQLEATMTLASVHLAKREIKASTDYIDRILSRLPNMGRALIIKGQLRMLENNHTEAKVCFENALQSLSSHVGTWHALAWCYLLSEEYEKCKNAFEMALNLDRNFAETYGGLAVFFALTGEVEKSNYHLERALRLDKRCFSGMFAKAVLLRQQGRNREADRIIDTILSSSVLEGDLPLRDIVRKLATQDNTSSNE